MTVELTRKWQVDDAWEAAVEVTASVYALEPTVLGAQSRGRGPRPPANVWEAKKMAVHLAVLLSDCDYAQLATHVGLHRDTVASHCADVRSLAADDAELEERSNQLTLLCMSRLDRGGHRGQLRAKFDLERRIAALEDKANLFVVSARLAALEDMLREAGFLHPSLIRQSSTHPTTDEDHGNVISLPSAARPGA